MPLPLKRIKIKSDGSRGLMILPIGCQFIYVRFSMPRSAFRYVLSSAAWPYGEGNNDNILQKIIVRLDTVCFMSTSAPSGR